MILVGIKYLSSTSRFLSLPLSHSILSYPLLLHSFSVSSSPDSEASSLPLSLPFASPSSSSDSLLPFPSPSYLYVAAVTTALRSVLFFYVNVWWYVDFLEMFLRICGWLILSCEFGLWMFIWSVSLVCALICEYLFDMWVRREINMQTTKQKKKKTLLHQPGPKMAIYSPGWCYYL